MPNFGPPPYAEEIEFNAQGVTLRGKFFRPANATGPVPAVVLQGGLGGPAEFNYQFAPGFAANGMGCLIYDHRYTGLSDGEPRQLFDPWQQARDLRHAITYLETRPDVDASRIGLWGISLGGANSLFVAAVDRRVTAVVSLIPPVSGLSAKKLHPAEETARFEEMIYADRKAQMQGAAPKLILLHGKPGGEPAMFVDQAGQESLERTLQLVPDFRNEVAVASFDYLFEMEVTAYASRIVCPTLLLLASEDHVAPVEDAREMFERIPEPKEKVEFPGQHYEILAKFMPDLMRTSMQFLKRNLGVEERAG